MPAPLTTRRFTVREYHRMAEAGILHPEERVELIGGEIVQRAAIGSRHAACVSRLTRLLMREVGDRASIRVQSPVRLSDLSEPEPDVAVVRSRSDDYAAAHPGPEDVLLLVEVAESTAPFDREVKAPLYAGAGIPEYWLVDLSTDRVEVYGNTGASGYLEIGSYRRGDLLRPSALPDIALSHADFLP